MSYKPYKRLTAMWYATLLWIFGFVWGAIVFMVPQLKNVPSITHVSKYPLISFPLLIFYAIALYFLTKKYLKDTGDRAWEGLLLGASILFLNIILDAVVYVILFKGQDYFSFLSIWMAYALFIVIPWLTGKNLERRSAS
jgi:hypothetical protein